jgi:hypothetical protein
MVQQVVALYDRLVAPVAPVTGDAADLLALLRTLDVDDYVTLIEHLRAEDAGDPTLFGRRWTVQHLRDILGRLQSLASFDPSADDPALRQPRDLRKTNGPQ